MQTCLNQMALICRLVACDEQLKLIREYTCFKMIFDQYAYFISEVCQCLSLNNSNNKFCKEP
jgi:hypothetical protein